MINSIPGSTDVDKDDDGPGGTPARPPPRTSPMRGFADTATAYCFLSSEFFSTKKFLTGKFLAEKLLAENFSDKKMWPAKISAKQYSSQNFWAERFRLKIFRPKIFQPTKISAGNIFRLKIFSAEKQTGRTFFRPEKKQIKLAKKVIRFKKFSAENFLGLFLPKISLSVSPKAEAKGGRPGGRQETPPVRLQGVSFRVSSQTK